MKSKYQESVGLNHVSRSFGLVNGLLDKQHFKRMGNAVWLFMWLVDRQTEAKGRVLGGKPIKRMEIMNSFGVSETQAGRWIKRLVEFGYIQTRRTPYGFSISICKPKKYFKNRTHINDNSGLVNNDQSIKTELPKMACKTDQKCSIRPVINGRNKEDLQVRHISRHKEVSKDEFDVFYKAYPKKRAKEKAKTAFDKAFTAWIRTNPSEQFLPTILTAVENAKKTADWQKDGGAIHPPP